MQDTQYRLFDSLAGAVDALGAALERGRIYLEGGVYPIRHDIPADLRKVFWF